MRTVPLTLKEANAYISAHHRHHKPVPGARLVIGAEVEGELVGVAVIARPVARMTDWHKVAEVTRLATAGYPNACSFLYGAAARLCKIWGFEKIITKILESEPGTSLKAADWRFVGMSGGGEWTRPSHFRQTINPGRKQCWEKDLR